MFTWFWLLPGYAVCQRFQARGERARSFETPKPGAITKTRSPLASAERFWFAALGGDAT